MKKYIFEVKVRQFGCTESDWLEIGLFVRQSATLVVESGMLPMAHENPRERRFSRPVVPIIASGLRLTHSLDERYMVK